MRPDKRIPHKFKHTYESLHDPFLMAPSSTCLGDGQSIWKPRQVSLPHEADSLKIDFFDDFQIDERFGFTDSIHFGKLLGHKLKHIFMIATENLHHDVGSSADYHYINDFIKLGQTLCNPEHFAPIGADANKCAGAHAHH